MVIIISYNIYIVCYNIYMYHELPPLYPPTITFGNSFCQNIWHMNGWICGRIVMFYSLGVPHLTALQGAVFSDSPGQESPVPRWAGLSQGRTRFFSPSPQLALQRPHSSQEPQEPSTVKTHTCWYNQKYTIQDFTPHTLMYFAGVFCCFNIIVYFVLYIFIV